MKVFISEGSRNAAHNLDDLSERWQLRKQGDSYTFTVPDTLPALKSVAEAQAMKAELHTIYENLALEKKRVRRESERDAIQAQHNHVTKLILQTKSAIQKLAGGEAEWRKGIDLNPEQKRQSRYAAYLLSIGEIEITETDKGFLVTIPKQNITVRVAVEGES